MENLTARRRRSRLCARACLISAALLCTLAGALRTPSAQVLPPAASPGAALPRTPPVTAEDVPEPPPAFPIPPPLERPLAEDEGQRLFVTRFELDGAEDRPKAGIDLAELSALLEELRVQRQGLDRVDENGFTDEERAEIVTFMREAVANPNYDYLGPEYEALVDRLRELKAERDAGMTVGQMQQVANAVTEYYRSAGFVLAQAYIPAQEVQDGRVRIAVLEGTLGNVLVEGNEKYSTDVLASPFDELIDAPVTADGIESAILTASDYPGLSAFGVFRPGREVGTTDLVLRVQDERSFDASVRVDNHGTRFTGRNRGVVDIALNNPTGAGDRISGTVIRQTDPSRSNFGEIRYERPLWAGTLVGGSYSRNPFSVGAELEASELSGESTNVDLYMDHSMVRSRAANVAGRLGWRRTQEVTKLTRAPVGLDELSYLFGELRFDSIDSEARAINAGTVGFAYGLGDQLGGNGEDAAAQQITPPRRRGASTKFASNEFWKVEGTFSRFQKIADTIAVLARVEGQWSNDLLTSTQQYSIGGPNNVRAYNVSEFLVDKSFYASMEWSFDAPFFADAEFHDGVPWGQVLKVSFFADWAWGQLNDPTPTDIANLNVGGIGAGVSFNLPGTVLGRLQYARPVGERVPGEPGDPASHKWWFDVTYQF